MGMNELFRVWERCRYSFATDVPVGSVDWKSVNM